MELPQDIMNYIKNFLPPHPLQKEISKWSRREYFYKWYFDQMHMQKTKVKINKFVNDNDFWLKLNRLSNEDAVKLKHKCFLDKQRLKCKLKSLNILTWECSSTTHIPTLNIHGNYSEVYYKGQEIIY